MSFEYPWLILILGLPIIWLFYLFITRKNEHQQLFDSRVYNRLLSSSNEISQGSRNLLFLLSILLIITALARPIIDEGEIKVKVKARDVVLAIDISRSMLATDRYPNRLMWAKNKALEFIKQSKNSRIGVVAFAQAGYVVAPLSFDYGAVSFMLSKLNTKGITEQGTNLEQMLLATSSILKDSKNRAVVLFSDGGDDSDFSKVIEIAKEQNIVLYIVAIGSSKGAPIELDDGAFLKDGNSIAISHLNSRIKEAALETGGAYVDSSTSDGDIKGVIEAIEKRVTAISIKERTVRKSVELFWIVLIFAAISLFFALFSTPKRSVIVVALLFLPLDRVDAGVFDFQKLKDAKEAYRDAKYKNSGLIYKEYTKEHKSAEALYNLGNTYYRQGDYAKAQEAYGGVESQSSKLRADSLHNLGNSFAKEKKIDEAIKAYEGSLAIGDNKLTRENLEMLKKLKQKNSKDEQNKNSKDEQKKNSKDEQKKNSKDEQKKNSKDEQQEQSKKDSDKDSKKSKKSKERSEHNQQSSREAQKDREELQRFKEKESIMSEAEVKKWMNYLKNQPVSTKMYKINSDSAKESSSVKPW